MEDKVFKVEFNVWANSKEEAETLGRTIGAFIDEHGKSGRKVTANKLTLAITRWQENMLVRNSIINYFR